MILKATQSNIELMQKICEELERTFERGTGMQEKRRITVYIDDDVIKVLDKIKEDSNISRSDLITIASMEFAAAYIDKQRKIVDWNEIYQDLGL